MIQKFIVSVFLCFISFQIFSAQYESRRFIIEYPDDFSNIQDVDTAFSAIIDYYDSIFKFDSGSVTQKLLIRITPDIETFQQYVFDRIGQKRTQYLYIKYENKARSEIVLYPMNPGQGYQAFAGSSLNRQLYLLYLYSHIHEPPVWIRDGFQAIIEHVSWNSLSRQIENSASSFWIEQARASERDQEVYIPAASLLLALTGQYETRVLYPQLCAFVSFLHESKDPVYQRFLHEAFLLLKPDTGWNSRSQTENSALVANRFTVLIEEGKADKDFRLWLADKKTFDEVFQEGLEAYSYGRYDDAERAFSHAASRRQGDPVVTYYRGLVSYSAGNFETAVSFYRDALVFGADIATGNWALGLAFYALERYDEAEQHIRTAMEVNPSRYGKRGEQLLTVMQK